MVKQMRFYQCFSMKMVSDLRKCMSTQSPSNYQNINYCMLFSKKLKQSDPANAREYFIVIFEDVACNKQNKMKEFFCMCLHKLINLYISRWSILEYPNRSFAWTRPSFFTSNKMTWTWDLPMWTIYHMTKNYVACIEKNDMTIFVSWKTLIWIRVVIENVSISI